MLFSSMTFIFAFLPLVLAFYFLLPKSWRNGVLLAFSLLFYAWGEPVYVFLMIAAAAVNYLGALMLVRFEKIKKIIAALTVAIDLGLLIFFKYTGFILENLDQLFGISAEPWKLLMPIGISFYIFQSISYLVDVYRKDIEPQRNFFKLLLFISCFPQMIAGPIIKYHDVVSYLDKREEKFADFVYGLKRFILGLSKKMLIANVLGMVADRVFEGSGVHYPVWMNYAGVLAYTFQIYYDFSGYSDMAIGLGALFGFKFMENFNYPYISGSVTEFWRRWHISLSTWFREYLYIPLGGNRVPPWRNTLNLLIVFLATGIWHGASWNFVLWGLWHGSFIMIEKFFKLHKKTLHWSLRIVMHFYTIAVFYFGWILFRAESVRDALAMVKRMFGLAEKEMILVPWQMFLTNAEIMAFIAALIFAFPVSGRWAGVTPDRPDIPCRRRWLVNGSLIILFILSVLQIAATTSNPFIYFRF